MACRILPLALWVGMLTAVLLSSRTTLERIPASVQTARENVDRRLRKEKWVNTEFLTHVVLFGGAGILALPALGPRRRRGWRRVGWLAAGFAYGAVLEGVQELWIVGRGFSGGDLLANAVGLLLAAAVGVALDLLHPPHPLQILMK